MTKPSTEVIVPEDPIIETEVDLQEAVAVAFPVAQAANDDVKGLEQQVPRTFTRAHYEQMSRIDSNAF